MNRIMDALRAHPSLIASLLGAALVAGVAIALSTLPLVPEGGGAGSAGSASAVAGGAAGSAQAFSPASDGAEPDGADDPTEAEGDLAVDEDPSGEARPQAGSSEDKGGEPQKGASSAKPSKPGKPSSGGSAGGATQKPAAGGGQAQKPSSGGSQSQKPSNPKPSHTHSWSAVYRAEPVYSQQWVSKWEDVYKGMQERYICRQCGATVYSGADLDAHFMNSYLNGGTCGTYIDDSYEIWEKEDHGSYQNVQTGTQQVLDHYECACGARK